MSRIFHPAYLSKVVSADDAAAMINHGDTIGFSGFTGAAYPKLVPPALAARIKDAHARGEEFRVNVWTGASTAPELDAELAATDGIAFRMPYQSDGVMRAKINAGISEYSDIHLSQSAVMVRQGFMGKCDVAVVEVAAILEDGTAVPSSSVGNNVVYMEKADKIILEVNSWQSLDLHGMHDIYYGTRVPPNRMPIPMTRPGDRIGQTSYAIPYDKVVAIVESDRPDRNTPFKPADKDSQNIAECLIDFLKFEVKQGRLPENLLPLQSGVGNIANAVLAGLLDSPFERMTSYTEVIQDGMVDLIDAGKITVASATAFSLSPDYATRMNEEAKRYRSSIILRQQEISNHPENIRRFGVIACNGMIEGDIYGNVNSTHIMGSKMQNGIGGSGDFMRNAYISMFVTPSVAKGGDISCFVPMVSHHDHTEHDVMVIISEQGLADLRGLSPKQRAKQIIENCAHPDYRPMLQDYFDRALKTANGKHTPHDLREAHSWHVRFLETGSMKKS